MPPKKKVLKDIPVKDIPVKDIPSEFDIYKYPYNHRIHPFKNEVNDPEDDTKDVLYYNTLTSSWTTDKLLCAKHHGLINSSESVYIINKKIIPVLFQIIIDKYTPILKIGTTINHNKSEITIQKINITDEGVTKIYNDNINIDKPFDVFDNSTIKDKTFFSKLKNFVLTTVFNQVIQYYYIDDVTDTIVSLKRILFYKISYNQPLYQPLYQTILNEYNDDDYLEECINGEYNIFYYINSYIEKIINIYINHTNSINILLKHIAIKFNETTRRRVY